MNDCFMMNKMKRSQRQPGLCACQKAERRPGQGNRAQCHCLANRVYRARQQQRREQANRAAMAELARRYAEQVQ